MTTSQQQSITIPETWHSIINHIQSSQDHVFITGQAGTGKSTLLHILRQSLSKPVAVLAPTGIAALNVDGETIHSFFCEHIHTAVVCISGFSMCPFFYVHLNHMNYNVTRFEMTTIRFPYKL